MAFNGTLIGTADLAVSAESADTATSATSATTATNAQNVNIDEKNDDVNYQVLFSAADSKGFERPYIDTDNSHFLYNPSTHRLTVGPITCGTISSGNISCGDISASAGSFSTVTASGNITAYSDAKKKKDIQNFANEAALDYFNSIEAKRYKWKENDAEDIGFIAQEVEGAGLGIFVKDNEITDPETGEVIDNIKSLDYSKMVTVLWQVVKHLSEEIETLKEKN